MKSYGRWVTAMVCAVLTLVYAAPGFARDAFHAGLAETAGEMIIFDGEAAEPEEEIAAFDEGEAPYDGEWVTFEDGFRLYVPTAWEPLEISEAEADAGIFYRVGDGEVGAAVSYLRAETLQTRDDLAGDFERAGFSGIRQLDLNGIEAIGFERPSDDYRGVAFFHPIEPGYILLVYTSPLGDAVAAAVLDSVSPFAAG